MTWPKAIITFFISLAIFNGFLVYWAVTSNKGLVEESSYDQGLSYQNVIDQVELGRSFIPEILIEKISDNNYLASFALKDKSGKNVSFASATLKALLPSSRDLSLTLEFIPNQDNTANVEFKLPDKELSKLWLIDLSASIHNDTARWKSKSILKDL